MNLLTRLQRTHGLALLFITHDLCLAKHLTTRMTAMPTGRIVEMAATAAIFDTPYHPCTPLP